MYKLCKSEQSATRQREFENTLLSLMKNDRYEDISICDLCEKMNTPRKTFYRYFSSKEGALFSLLDHTVIDFYETGSIMGLRGGTPEGDLVRFFEFWYSKKELLDALKRSNLTGVLVERCTLLARQERLAPSLTRDWDTFKQGIAISFAVCGLLSIVFKWHQDGFNASPHEMSDIATEMLSNPLLPRA